MVAMIIIIIIIIRSGVNDATCRLAPDSMQFGHALQRILQCMYDADPRYGSIDTMKVDIADGFYHVGLAPEDVPSLGVCLPPGPDGKTLVASPLVLPMGWVESPPHFCAVTETIERPCVASPWPCSRGARSTCSPQAAYLQFSQNLQTSQHASLQRTMKYMRRCEALSTHPSSWGKYWDF